MSDYHRGERGERGERGPAAASQISIAVIIAIGSMLIGIAGTVFASGGYIRQIEVNSASIKEISEHGTGILQALKNQVQSQQTEINGIRADFRPREFWEQLERRIASLEQQQAKHERQLQDGRN